jgi:DNA-binding response OmpR family regulator
MSARVLLIEDDASIARFIGLALEELPGHDPAAPPVELHLVRHVAEAREALAAGGWQLVISDLMLPDGSAETLLTEGFAQAAGAPPGIVFSAGVHADRHLALAARGVARTLRKPVPLAELLDTVAELLRPGALAPASAQHSSPQVVDPVQQHFGGDRALYESFRASCIERFGDDLMQGDAAVATGDAAVLCRVAHALKAVLEMIGQPALAGQARALEAATTDGALGAPERAAWSGLAGGLQTLGARRRG